MHFDANQVVYAVYTHVEKTNGLSETYILFTNGIISTLWYVNVIEMCQLSKLWFNNQLINVMSLWFQNQPTNQSLTQSINQSINQSLNHKMITNQSINQSINQLHNLSINKSINHVINQSQLITQSISQLISLKISRINIFFRESVLIKILFGMNISLVYVML